MSCSKVAAQRVLLRIGSVGMTGSQIDVANNPTTLPLWTADYWIFLWGWWLSDRLQWTACLLNYWGHEKTADEARSPGQPKVMATMCWQAPAPLYENHPTRTAGDTPGTVGRMVKPLGLRQRRPLTIEWSNCRNLMDARYKRLQLQCCWLLREGPRDGRPLRINCENDCHILMGGRP